jgi:hypothetical protein
MTNARYTKFSRLISTIYTIYKNKEKGLQLVLFLVLVYRVYRGNKAGKFCISCVCHVSTVYIGSAGCFGRVLDVFWTWISDFLTKNGTTLRSQLRSPTHISMLGSGRARNLDSGQPRVNIEFWVRGLPGCVHFRSPHYRRAPWWVTGEGSNEGCKEGPKEGSKGGIRGLVRWGSGD